MPNTVVCYKWVIDEADIKINTDLSVDFSRAKEKISDYDKNAIEAAVQASKILGGKALGLTYGTKSIKTSLKDALSRGLDAVFYIMATEEADKTDGASTAKVLASAIQKIEDVGLVICADGASDTYARQTASRIGTILNLPVITSVIKTEITGNTLTAIRKLDDCFQTVQAELPVVVAILPEMNTSPIPGLKSVLAAGKKPVTEFKIAELGIDLSSQSKVLEVKGYAMNRKKIIFKNGEAAGRIKELLSALKKEGVL